MFSDVVFVVLDQLKLVFKFFVLSRNSIDPNNPKKTIQYHLTWESAHFIGISCWLMGSHTWGLVNILDVILG